jgi:outer membrane protein assembly factor BamA
VRGFDLRGIGPSEPRRRSGSSSSSSSGDAAAGGVFTGGGEGQGVTRDALGGDLFSTIYAGLMVRLPGQVGDLGAHAHVFANGGSAVLLSGSSAAAAAAAGSSGGSSGGALGALGRRLQGGLQQIGRSHRWSAGESDTRSNLL